MSSGVDFLFSRACKKIRGGGFLVTSSGDIVKKRMKLWVSAIAMWAFAVFPSRADTNDMFKGGWYDGWDWHAASDYGDLGGAQVTLSSAADQLLDFYVEPGLLEDVTITDDDPHGITNEAVLTLSLPQGLPALRFDVTDVSCSGTAAGKIGSASLSVDERSVLIPVTQDFAGGDTLTISGLAVHDPPLSREGVGRLSLEFSGDGITDTYDKKIFAVRVCISGGQYDGWDANASLLYYKLIRPITMFKFTRLFGEGGSVGVWENGGMGVGDRESIRVEESAGAPLRLMRGRK